VPGEVDACGNDLLSCIAKSVINKEQNVRDGWRLRSSKKSLAESTIKRAGNARNLRYQSTAGLLRKVVFIIFSKKVTWSYCREINMLVTCESEKSITISITGCLLCLLCQFSSDSQKFY
jgi:hypothetical protein